jgi:hypothetical protein
MQDVGFCVVLVLDVFLRMFEEVESSIDFVRVPK